MWKVYDSGKPADTSGYPGMQPDWPNSEFATIEEAQNYAMKWLGEWAPKSRYDLTPGKTYVYGMGNWIEIREVTRLHRKL